MRETLFAQSFRVREKTIFREKFKKYFRRGLNFPPISGEYPVIRDTTVIVNRSRVRDTLFAQSFRVREKKYFEKIVRNIFGNNLII